MTFLIHIVVCSTNNAFFVLFVLQATIAGEEGWERGYSDPTLKPPVLSISFKASWLLPTIHTRAFIEAYRLSTVVAMATNPSTTDVPPTEDNKLLSGCICHVRV